MSYEKDIADRTRQFAVQVIRFCKTIPVHAVTTPLIRQLVRAGTSIGANVIEAHDAVSRKDFTQKISLALREARETLYWLSMLAESQLIGGGAADRLLKEADEILRILVTITKNSRK